VARVLVVDDDPDVLALVSHQLSRRGGHQVLQAASGPEALQVLEGRDPPDLAVLDVTMPEMTGLELATALRERYPRPTGPALPVVFLSARVQPSDVEAGRALGATYLTKPFVGTALLTAVDEALATTAAESTGW
jgi:CheY-like chemotaxis protein